MDPSTETLEAGDGTDLYLRVWAPETDVRAAILLLHGVGEHGGRYEALASRLAGAGILVLGPDLRGHGHSGGPRVHVSSWTRYLDDARAILARLRTLAPGAPVFVYGHSMGSLIALDLAMSGERDVRGWILSGAGVEPSGIAKPHLVAIARILTRVAPRVRLALGIRGAQLSHDPDVARRYDEDPLTQGRATVRWGTEALASIDRIREGAGGIVAPALVLHGGDDPLSRAQGSRWLASTLGGETELIVYEGALHEPHHEAAHGDVAGDIVRWIASTLSAPVSDV